MDSWLTAQQHHGPATERPPLSKSQGNHASTELRRGGTMRPTPARWKPTVGRQQRHQQAPPNDALREKLAVRSNCRCLLPEHWRALLLLLLSHVKKTDCIAFGSLRELAPWQ